MAQVLDLPQELPEEAQQARQQLDALRQLPDGPSSSSSQVSRSCSHTTQTPAV